MPRFFLAALILGVLLTANLFGDDKDTKDKKSPPPILATIVKVDAKKGEITVKFTDSKSKETEKTYTLAEEVRLFDETGRTVKIDVFQSGGSVLIVETDGKLRELRRAVPPHPGQRLSDAVKTLIEMTDVDEAYVADLQRIYDTLRKLDTDKNGKINLAALKAERERILEGRVDDLIKRLDTNKDGKISKDEAKGWVKESFDKIDLNKDGFLDRDELIKAAKEQYEAQKPQPEKK
jgi:Ca2+-binding EF-hand superfamily protein